MVGSGQLVCWDPWTELPDLSVMLWRKIRDLRAAAARISYHVFTYRVYGYLTGYGARPASIDHI